jgi:glycyl-tRNA synthetase
MAEANVMEKIVSLCKRRGFVYPASEIYGGINGFWDYGPLGSLLKNNIRDSWWRTMVEAPPIGPDGHPIEMVGVDTSIIQHPQTWVASGHASGFADPMVDDRETKQRYRPDHLSVIYAWDVEPESGDETQAKYLFAYVEGDDASYRKALKKAQKEAKKTGAKVIENPPRLRLTHPEFDGYWEFIYAPDAEHPGTLTEPRQFNLMLGSEVGAVDPVKVYLRPETAQGIFLNFKNIIDTTRVKIPFGVAQIGKSFRNEVTPRNFIFRSREFEQMEMEFFCHPDESRMWYDFWTAERMRWWQSIGVKKENLRLREHEKDELSHYSKMTVDIEYKYPFTAPDFGELEGIAHRGDYDLTQHQKHSGNRLDYFDQELQLKLKAEGKSDEEVKAKSRYIPNVIEPASGLTRAVLLLLCEAYAEDATRPSPVYLKFDPKMAPIKVGIFPLVNKEGMPEIAEKLYMDLRQKFMCEYDPKQSIGKRYARMDEIGTPYCMTIDGQTLTDQTVTIRERDTLKQERVSLDKISGYLSERLSR